MGNFSPCCDRITDRSNVREEGFNLVHGSRAQSTMLGSRGDRSSGVAGHITTTVWKQRERVGCWYPDSVQDLSPLGRYRPQLEWVFPPQLTKPRSSLTDVPRGFSPGCFKSLSSSYKRI